MKTFILDDDFYIKCECIEKRNGFEHVATLFKNGVKIARYYTSYVNRSWERFEFEAIILQAIKDHFKDDQLKKHIETVKTFN